MLDIIHHIVDTLLQLRVNEVYDQQYRNHQLEDDPADRQEKYRVFDLLPMFVEQVCERAQADEDGERLDDCSGYSRLPSAMLALVKTRIKEVVHI